MGRLGLGLGVGVVLWAGASGLACDGPCVVGVVGEAPAPGVVEPPALDLAPRPLDREWLAQAPAVTPPAYDPAQSGLRCADAIAIDRGLSGVPVSGGGSGSGCFGGTWPTRYFTLTVNPNEIVEVRVELEATIDDTVWLVAQPDCDSRPSTNGWHCGLGWAHASTGLVIHNSGTSPATWIVGARRLDSSEVTGTFDLEVLRHRPAQNATCENATRIAGQTFQVDPRGAGVTEDPTYKRGLYYEVELPPMTRATVRPTETTHHYLFLQTHCGGERLHELYNAGDTPMTALVVVNDVHGMDDPPFGAELLFEPVSAEGFCGSPTRLEVDATVEVEPKLGGPSPDQCWCVASGRVVYIEVVVPARSEVEVRGETDDPTASVVLADQPAQCASECGFTPAFGFEGVASLRLLNEGDEAKSYHLLVESQRGWSETSSPEDPAVRLTARRVDGR